MTDNSNVSGDWSDHLWDFATHNPLTTAIIVYGTFNFALDLIDRFTGHDTTYVDVSQLKGGEKVIIQKRGNTYVVDRPKY